LGIDMTGGGTGTGADVSVMSGILGVDAMISLVIGLDERLALIFDIDIRVIKLHEING
jgi:hypothetical protein